VLLVNSTSLDRIHVLLVNSTWNSQPLGGETQHTCILNSLAKLAHQVVELTGSQRAIQHISLCGLIFHYLATQMPGTLPAGSST